MTVYRDPLAGLRGQVAAKRALVEAKEQAITPLLRALLPEALAAKLRALRGTAVGEASSVEALSAADVALDEAVRLLDEAARLGPKLRECPDEVEDPPKSPIGPPWAIEERDQIKFRLLLTRRLAELSAEAWLVRWDDTTYLSRLRVGGAPVIVTARVDLTPAQPSAFRCTARTSVPATTPSLEVRREGLFDGIGRTLGLVHDAETGDPALDDPFVVVAGEGALELLASDVRRALVALVPWKPRLALKRGVVDLVWSGAYEGAAGPLWPDAALGVVLGIRAAIERG